MPRVMMNYWMQEKFVTILKMIEKNSNIFQIRFFKGEIIGLKKNKNYFDLIFKNNLCEEQHYKILKNQINHISFKKKMKTKKKLSSKNLNISQLYERIKVLR